MAYETLDLEVADHVAHVTLNRPDELNTLSAAFWRDIRALFRALDDDGAVRVVVISSTGRHFSAGIDLAFFQELAPDATLDQGRQRERLRRLVLDLQDCFTLIESCRKPVLLAVQGAAIGGAMDMAAACDMRYCTVNAYFSLHEINIGITADLGSLQRLPHLMPAGLLRELAYSGRRLPADEAHAAGFVNRVFESHEAMIEGVMGIAREIAARTPLAITGAKEMLNYARDHSVADGLAHVSTWNAAMIVTDDLAEGLAAQMQKRPPQYADLLARKKLD
jgi:enoyl-CoA hydratase